VRLTDSGLDPGMRFAFAATAAFSTREKGGLMPQARQGGRGKDSVAMVGSKLEGTGFEKEQIGHTQVPTTSGDGVGDIADDRNGLEARVVGVEEDATF